MKTTLIRRVFKFDGAEYPDPNPTFSIKRVQGFLANTKPPIVNAVIVSDKTIGNKRVIELSKNAGTHG